MNTISVNILGQLKGHNQNHPTVLKSCQKKEREQIRSFGWTIENNVNDLGIGDKVLSPTVPFSIVSAHIGVDRHCLVDKYAKGYNKK